MTHQVLSEEEEFNDTGEEIYDKCELFSGEEFNKQYKNYEFYKLLNENLKHFGFTYENGLNVDTNKFNSTEECSKGGLYFIEKNKIPMWIGHTNYHFITKCFIPNDANVCVENDKFKSDKLIVDINNKTTIANSSIWNDYNFCKFAIQENSMCLMFINRQTEELCKMAIQQCSFSLRYVNEQTEELCKMAIQQDSFSLRYVNEQNEEICKLAVQKYGLGLQYVKNQTEEICKLAVQECGGALEYVKEQTEEICKLAIMEDHNALIYVREQTEELRNLAIKQRNKSLSFIDRISYFFHYLFCS